MKNKIYTIIAFCTFLVAVSSCKPADYYYGDYLKNGEIYYPGRIDSLTLIPGNKRAILRFQMTTDPKVKLLKVFLRNSLSAKQTIIPFDVAPNSYGKIREINLDQLEEATYSVDVRSYSGKDSSQSVNTNQYIYGERYNLTLINRTFSSFDKTNSALHKATFNSESNLPREGTFFPMQYTEVVYQKLNGEMMTVKITPYETKANLQDIVSPSTIKYRTVYKPLVQSIDFFYTPYKEISYTK
ncbi:DUF4998 domain-containing protein [Sphingobacterium anhuiense]|uniref:DUF4998 domain-containing protein n=1 Tax=Sphingobacterium anhuiense TaxID=493780 RepID=A0ABW5YTR1_9SPHI